MSQQLWHDKDPFLLIWLLNYLLIYVLPKEFSLIYNFICSLFYVPPKKINLYGDLTITSEGLQNLGLCSALRAFEQESIFILPHLWWHVASVLPVSFEGPPHLINRLLRLARLCGGPILTLSLTGPLKLIDLCSPSQAMGTFQFWVKNSQRDPYKWSSIGKIVWSTMSARH
jgi:hypothetical protein